jgi:hypothetical protein
MATFRSAPLPDVVPPLPADSVKANGPDPAHPPCPGWWCPLGHFEAQEPH